MATFGERARELMAAQGVSLRELARRTFYDKAHLSRILNGRKPASPELARRVDTANGRLGDRRRPPRGGRALPVPVTFPSLAGQGALCAVLTSAEAVAGDAG